MNLWFSYRCENKWKLIACLESESWWLWPFLLDIWYWQSCRWALARTVLSITSLINNSLQSSRWETLPGCFLEHFWESWESIPISTRTRPMDYWGIKISCLSLQRPWWHEMTGVYLFIPNGIENLRFPLEEGQDTPSLPPISWLLRQKTSSVAAQGLLSSNE